MDTYCIVESSSSRSALLLSRHSCAELTSLTDHRHADLAEDRQDGASESTSSAAQELHCICSTAWSRYLNSRYTSAIAMTCQAQHYWHRLNPDWLKKGRQGPIIQQLATKETSHLPLQFLWLVVLQSFWKGNVYANGSSSLPASLQDQSQA